jgi:predicted lipid-binding transport protein (Tim44 family)
MPRVAHLLRRSVAAATLLVLTLAATAHAAAGGGSSGFGGGGGGGGGFSGGGGGGGFAGGGGSGSGGGGGFVWVVVVFVVLFVFVIPAMRRGRMRRATRAEAPAERVQAVGLAAAEAAEDDAAFAAQAVTDRARDLYLEIQDAWSRDDRDRLRELVFGDLMAEWDRRLDDFGARGQRNVVEVQDLQVQQVGLVNRTADEEDRVVVLMQARQRDYVQQGGRRLMRTDDPEGDAVAVVHEFWTLAKRDGAWCLHSIEQPAEGMHNLADPLVATPAADGRVRDEAVFEIAAADKVADDQVRNLLSVDYEGDARAQAQDAALVDGRFAAEVLETAVRRAVEAWLDAVDGSDDALLAIADTAAVDALLYGGDAARESRIVVRGARVLGIAIARCDVHAQPAELDVHVDVEGVRYREDRDTLAVLDGDKRRARRWQEAWTLTLSGDDGGPPWRLVPQSDSSVERSASSSSGWRNA